MQQVAGKQRFWWRAQDAQTSGPGAAFRESYLSYPEETARAVGDGRQKPTPKRRAMALQIPRGERRYRGPMRRRRRWTKPLLAVGLLALLTGAAAIALPLDQVRSIDLGSVVGTKASDAMIAAGFGLDQVNVSGQHHAADGDIFDALDLPNVRTFAAFDSDAALQRIERIPWIDTAQITRVYPGTLDIVVHERTPAVLWTRGVANYLVDASGRVLGPVPAQGN